MLERINSPADIKQLDAGELECLCTELRAFLLESVLKTGGHLASNLGAVELTVAIHRVFDTSRDMLVFDVGHQCYTHKILTGRRDSFHTLRRLNGISGFPKPSESIHDAFISGHASTSVSVALGMARACKLMKGDYSVIAVMGDGALTGGAIYEALNDAGQSGEPLIVILNDNGMSITENVGSVAEHLARLRVKPQYFTFKKGYHKLMSVLPGGKSIYHFIHSIKTAAKKALFPCSIFESMGFTYLGPADGNNLGQVTHLLERAKFLNRPVLIHLRTTKGKGYAYSEENPDEYHSVSSPGAANAGNAAATFSSEFGECLTELAQGNDKICAVTAAMQGGTGLSGYAKAFPERFFDVGIAEQHAAAMVAGMAKQGMIPVFAVYSSFLQRAYDMLIHDIAIQKLHVVLAVDRAGLVGDDGETHQGVFDASFLSQIPHMTVLCPSNYAELRSMLTSAAESIHGPVAVRYPRGGEQGFREDTSCGDCSVIAEGTDVTIVAYGILINNAIAARDGLLERGISAELIKINMLNPLNPDKIIASAQKTGRILIVEDSILEGSAGQRIAACLYGGNIQVSMRNLGQQFIPQGTVRELQEVYGLDSYGIMKAATELI